MAKRKTLSPGYILRMYAVKGRRSFRKQQVCEAAATMGHNGGIVGGPARADALSSARRSEIASHAANVRWGQPCFCSQCKAGGFPFNALR